ncbi:MAG TPA: hypothetical protein VF928_07570 [Usitatibacteraceae bacterium]
MKTTSTTAMTVAEALAFIRDRGVVLVSAKGPVPRLTEAIIGEPIQGGWWAHPRGREIFAVLDGVSDSADVLFCRLVDGKITLVHRRLWPALVRLAARFPPDRLAQVRQEHTAIGRHVNHETPFPDWVPAAVSREASTLSEEDALLALGAWALAANPAGNRKSPRRNAAKK